MLRDGLFCLTFEVFQTSKVFTDFRYLFCFLIQGLKPLGNLHSPRWG